MWSKMSLDNSLDIEIFRHILDPVQFGRWIENAPVL
jgi:hypothetical protein